MSVPDPLPEFLRLEQLPRERRSDAAWTEAFEFSKALLCSARDCVKLLDFDARLLFFNPGAGELLECEDLSQLLGQYWPDFWTGADRAACLAALDEARCGRMGRFEGFCATFKGTPKWWDVIITPIRDANGAVGKLLAVSRDITERKRSEQALHEREVGYRRAAEALQESEARFRALFEQSPFSIQIFSSDGTALSANEAWEKLWETSMDEMAGYNILQDPQLAAKGVLPYIQRAFNGQPVAIPPIRYDPAEIPRAGRARWVEAYLYPVQGRLGELREVVLVLHDVTDRIEAEMAMRAEHGRFKLLTDHLSVLVSYIDKDLFYRFNNAAYRDWLGLEPGEICGRHMREILGEDIFKTRQPYLEAVLKGRKVTFEAPARHARLGLRRTEVTYVPDVSPESEVRGFYVTVNDITERTQRAEQLESLVAERTAELRDTIAALEAFSYSISHDLRAPLRAMQGFSHCLLEDYRDQLDAGAQEYLRRITQSAEMMSRLIEGVLDYNRILRSNLEPQTVDLDKLVPMILQSRPEYQPPCADIEIIGPLRVVRGNEAGLTQCISNFLCNAVKFVAPGVRPRIRIWSELHGDQVKLCVQDNGVGIRKEDQERVFELFTRLEPARDGFGVGLSIVQRAIRRMGGTVGLESEPGKGSCFWIKLPA